MLTTYAMTGTTATITTYRALGPFTESDEDPLLAFSQETNKRAPGCTRHSTPEYTAINIVGTNQSTHSSNHSQNEAMGTLVYDANQLL